MSRRFSFNVNNSAEWCLRLTYSMEETDNGVLYRGELERYMEEIKDAIIQR